MLIYTHSSTFLVPSSKSPPPPPPPPPFYHFFSHLLRFPLSVLSLLFMVLWLTRHPPLNKYKHYGKIEWMDSNATVARVELNVSVYRPTFMTSWSCVGQEAEWIKFDKLVKCFYVMGVEEQHFGGRKDDATKWLQPQLHPKPQEKQGHETILDKATLLMLSVCSKTDNGS